MIKAVIFDLDGVIIESVDIKTKAFRKLFEQEYPQKIAEIVQHHLQNMGVSRFVKFRYIYEKILGLPFSAEDEQELGERFSGLVLKEVLTAPFIKGALRFLKTNYDKFPLFIISGTPQAELDYIVKERGIAGYFQEVHGTPPGKAEIISDLLKRKMLKSKDVVFIGDADTDLIAASNTGVNFIARINSGSIQSFRDCKHKVNDLCKLDTLLKGGIT